MSRANLTDNSYWPDSLAIRRRRMLSLAVLVVTVSAGELLIWLGGAREVVPWWIALLYPAFFFAAAFSCARAGSRLEGDESRAWNCFGLGCFSYATAELVWGFNETFLGIELPSPSVADMGYFSSALFYMCGLWYCHNRAPSSGVNFVQIGNLGIIVSATLLAYMLLYYELLQATVSLPVATMAVAYGAMDVTAALVAFVVVYLHVWGQRRFVMLLILLGLSVSG